MTTKYYAHSKENEPTINWQLLEEHLVNVAKCLPMFFVPAIGVIWRGFGMMREGR